MAASQAGNAGAYDELLRLLASAARGVVGRRIGRVDWAEDVVQDVLLTVHRSRMTYDPARPFGPWFYAIVTSRLVDALRARRRRGTAEPFDEDALQGWSPARADTGPSDDVRLVLAQAVARLPRVQREVVSLLKYEDLSVRDVASRLGMSESAVKVTAHRGYAHLRQRLKGAWRENRAAH
jgi:RNA polymerase sigma-70 factor (ECF subfamily)